MRGIARHLLLPAVVATAGALACPAPGQAADVKAVRVWAGSSYTRVVFDLSAPARYTLNPGDDGIHLALDDSRAAANLALPHAQGLFKGLVVQRHGSDLDITTRTAGQARPKVFALGPGSGNGNRLVLDLYPDGSSAPSGGKAAVVAAAEAVAAAPALPPPADVDDSDDDAAAVPPARAPRGTRSANAATREASLLLNGSRKVVIAIDPGHGGEDPGAHGPGGTLEKNVTLAVARQLAEQINRQPGMKAVLTRNGDYFIPLKRRYEIARQQSADMFVSIHADAFSSGDARGSSVWVLSPRGKTNEAARWLADRENRADLIGNVSLDDKDDSLAAVLLDMQQGYAMQASESIAGNVLKALGLIGPTHRGYVERANFVVLRSPDVPSILVETAFISNPNEERKLRDPSHQSDLADAVTNGVRNYFELNPPLGTWFAAQAAHRNGTLLAAGNTAAAAPVLAGNAAVASASKKVADKQVLASRSDEDVRDLHRVGRGESLRSIARQYGVSVGALKSANRLSQDSVRVGSVLAIPTG